MTEFDLIVIGAGPGGYVAAIRAAQLGMRTALVEKMETLGGTCLNVGCIPSKSLIDSSGKYHALLNTFSEHGIDAKGVTLNLPQLIARKSAVVKKLTTGVAGLIKGNTIQRFTGTGILRSDRTVDVYENPQPVWERSTGGLNQSDNPLDEHVIQNTKPIASIRARRIILATGSVPIELPFMPFDGKRIISSTGALSLMKLPKTLAVIGAGAIGLEMASVWASLGVKVTIVEMMEQILPGWDSQIARTLKRDLRHLNIEYILNSSVSVAQMLSREVKLQLEKQELRVDMVLVATGRSANLHSAGIQELGIILSDDDRHIAVNDDYQTNLDGIYAIGDLVPGPQLAHKAEDEAVVAVERMNDIPAHVNYSTIPSVVYTNPEVASIGVSEDQLKAEGREYQKGVFNIAGNGRALAMGAQEGFVKILTDPRSDRILGAHIVAHEASNLISELVTIMEMRGSSEDIARITHAHPTFSEAVKEAALAVHGRSLHSLQK